MPKTGQSGYDRRNEINSRLKKAGALEKYPPLHTEQYTDEVMYGSGNKAIALRQRLRVAEGDALPKRGYAAKEIINKRRAEDQAQHKANEDWLKTHLTEQMAEIRRNENRVSMASARSQIRKKEKAKD